MSASDKGYRRWAARFNELGWNACFVHLPYHYSRVPRGYWNGELAITADLIRNAEGLRQGVIELRQLMAALRECGCREFGVLGTSYGGWIGALLAIVERDFRFLALMAPIVNVEHAIWESPASAFMRRELHRANIERSLVARHFHLSSPTHNQPLCRADCVLFVAGEFDLIARLADIEKIQQKWSGSELLRVPQGHFGYRMIRETIARLKERGLGVQFQPEFRVVGPRLLLRGCARAATLQWGLKILTRHLPGDKMMVPHRTVARTSLVAHGPNELLGDVSYWFTQSVRLIRLLSIPGPSQSRDSYREYNSTINCSLTIGCISSREGMCATLPLKCVAIDRQPIRHRRDLGQLEIAQRELSRFRFVLHRDFIARLHIVGRNVDRCGRSPWTWPCETSCRARSGYWRGRAGKQRCRGASRAIAAEFHR